MSDASSFGERQLELFTVPQSARPQPRRHLPGWVMLSLRHDQLILAGIAALIGVTVVFATGVERGKQLVRSERVLFSRTPEPDVRQATPPKTAPSERGPEAANADTRPQQPAPRTPAVGPKAKPAPVKVVAEPSLRPVRVSGGRYAVQVVSYAQAQRAKQEMDRLHSNGEPAFLVMRNGYTVVFVGPFPSKDDALGKISGLRNRYRDCFVKSL